MVSYTRLTESDVLIDYTCSIGEMSGDVDCQGSKFTWETLMYSWQYVDMHYLAQKLVRDLFLCREENNSLKRLPHIVIMPLMKTKGNLLP